MSTSNGREAFSRAAGSLRATAGVIHVPVGSSYRITRAIAQRLLRKRQQPRVEPRHDANGPFVPAHANEG